MPDYHDEKFFENEVRRIARLLWPDAEHDGAAMADGRERDGLFETEECFHIVEATVSRAKDKAEQDLKKSVDLALKLQRSNPGKAVKCWFVTKEEPTADQRAVATRYSQKYPGMVVTTSFSQFQAKLINARDYLSARDRYAFGSVRDPQTDKPDTKIGYVTLDLVDRSSGKLWKIPDICAQMLNGGRFLFLGDYGAGKSMTMRELYFELKKRYNRHATTKFPIYLNLRDHLAQQDPTEALERHARSVGFSTPSHLVRAWRAGYAILLLDGFDEVGSVPWVGPWKRLQDARFSALQLIRRFISDTPGETGLAVAGRAYYFDGERERNRALGISTNYIEVSLNDFTEPQIQEYLKKNGFDGKVPPWVPSRPLLLGTLLARGVVGTSLEDDMSASSSVLEPATGWELLVDQITRREARIEAGIDHETLRRIYERLATKARVNTGGLGPLSMDQIAESFREVCGYPPDEQANILLQRLPGLGIAQEAEGSRKFIDEDLADVCRTGDIVEFAVSPYVFPLGVFDGVTHGLNHLGIRVAANRLEKLAFSPGKMKAALQKAQAECKSSTIICDLARVLIDKGWSAETRVRVDEAVIPFLELTSGQGFLAQIRFDNCYIGKLELEDALDAERLPRFYECYFDHVEGCNEDCLPIEVFDATCEFGTFLQPWETTNAILDSDLPLGTQVLLTVLKKLYLQRGSGRQESAFYRGLHHSARRVVPDVLRLVLAEGLATTYPSGGLSIWVPSRAETARVGRILSSPAGNTDSIVAKTRLL